VPRARLFSLWISQVARGLGDWCLRTAAIAALVDRAGMQPASAWHLATVVFIAPFILLAPLNGYLSNSLPRRWVLIASAAFTILVLLPFPFVPPVGGQWIWLLGLTAFATAIYQSARFAVLPAAAADTHITLPRVNSWMEMGYSGAILGGILAGRYFAVPDAQQGIALLQPELGAALVGINLVCLLGALFVAFPSDVVRPEKPSHAITGFLDDVGRIFRDRRARFGLLGLASFQALVTAGSGVMLAGLLASRTGPPDELLRTLTLVGLGGILGSAAAGLQPHPVRNLGLIPLGALGLLGALAWGGLTLGTDGNIPASLAFFLGCMGGLVNVPLRAAFLAALPDDARGNGTSVMHTTIYVFTALLALLMYGLTQGGVLPTPLLQFGFLGVLAFIGAVLALRRLFREIVENVVELVFWPLYRIRTHGPGADRLPRRGPLLIVSNHTAYLDPFWVGIATPRSLVPMMTSVFYDRPFIRWWMVHVVGAIRVEAANFRREAPELQEAIRRLRQGECVILFPEARLRPSQDILLRPFGQGAWHILRQVPETVVAVIWIEGGWGSWTSYFKGPPMTNKGLDWYRHIDISIGEPAPLPAEMLKDHRTTREYLRTACLACRQYLGLPPVTVAPKPKKADRDAAEEPA
jgi:1-acyl-sn-glycerol-3-phosphate acyltransferase